MPIRPLSKELQEVAINELNEVPSKVQADIDHIREWISQQPHLKARTDDQWLLIFLRHSKFSLQRAKETIDWYYTVRKLAPELQSYRDPFLPEIQEALKEGIIVILPKTAHAAAPRIALVRMNKLKAEKISLLALVTLELMMSEILFLEDDNFTVAGFSAILDLKELPSGYIPQINPNFLKKLIMYAQGVYPLRIKEFNYYNCPTFVLAAYNIAKVFMSNKIKDRVHFYADGKIDTTNIPKSILPKEYGGDEVSCDEIAAYWKTKVESYRDWFLEDAQYGTDETKRFDKSQFNEELFGIEGSFVKLEID